MKAFGNLHDRLTWKYRYAAVISIAGRFLVWKVSKLTRLEINKSVHKK